MIRHVLVAVDDSECSMDALSFALEEHPEARFTAIHVINPGELVTVGGGIDDLGTIDIEELREQREAEADRLLDRVRSEGAAAGVEIETEVRTGQVAKAIVSFAEEAAVDVIVVGSHGRRGASRVLLGSVAEGVARRSSIPVTIVR